MGFKEQISKPLLVTILIVLSTTTGPVSVSAGGLIWAEDFQGCHAEAIQVDVMISNPDNAVDAFGFYLDYCTSALTYTSCVPGDLDPGWEMFDCNETAPGELRITGFAYPGQIAPGDPGSIVTLMFDVDCSGCIPGDSCPIPIYNLTDDLSGWSVATGEFTYSCPATPTPVPVTSDTLWIENFTGCTGDTVQVDVLITNPDTAVDAMSFYLNYCEDSLEYVSCATGDLNPEWEMFGCNVVTPGEIRVFGFAYPGSIPTGSAGTLVQLTFNVLCTPCTTGETCPLAFSHVGDDLTGWIVENGTFTCTCVATPTPVGITSDVIWIEDFEGCTGETIDVDVIIDNPDTDLDVFGFYLESCCDEMLEFITCVPGDLDPGWELFNCSFPEPGQVRSAGFAYPGTIPAGSSGVLATLTFQVTCTGCIGGETCDLFFRNLSDDLTGWSMGNATFMNTCFCIKNGDVNGDGFISAEDAQMAFGLALEMFIPTFHQECAADCNDSGSITAGDAQAIFGVIFGGSCVDLL